MSNKYRTDDLRIADIKEVANPLTVCEEFPASEDVARVTYEARNQIQDIMDRKDDRLIVITGPCSIHDTKAAMEFASRLAELRVRFANNLLIIMRTYFEKPRTTVGWKGLINDPDLDNGFHINKGLRVARKLVLDINALGVPVATEYLDIITPQYIADAIAWGAIGARTTESQVHREMASGLSGPVGFKNGTKGNLQIAVDAIGAARHPHHFLSLTKAGQSAIYHTTGNPYAHIILRGGSEPNYSREHVNQTATLLQKAGLPELVMIDFSHANSRKIATRQLEVCADVSHQIADGDARIFGAMIESHLVEGRQDASSGKELVYGQSITDACIGWDDNVRILDQLAESVAARRARTRRQAS
ncbi:MAG: phospho-2-dehydro-3-deoxyheptonate aldolase [marine bacterium B5-7]|nr:MAG: phospho-2-dehydro-3-deoxyheptonate aldolase [marine bacterium B5-7]